MAKALRTGERVGSTGFTSITAQNAAIHQLIATGGGLTGFLVGPGTGLAGLASTLLTPPLIAALLTRPKAVQVLSSPGFGRLSLEFERRHVSREGAATMIRLLSALQDEI